MLGREKADPFCTELTCMLCIGRRVCVRPYLQRPYRVGPTHQRTKITGQLRLSHRYAALEHLARGAIDGDDVATNNTVCACFHDAKPRIDLDHSGAGNAGPAHAARYDRSMTCHSTPSRKDALRRMHAVNVFRTGFGTHEYDVVTVRGHFLGFVGGKRDLACCCTR